MSDPKRWWPESEEEMMDAEEGDFSPPAPKTCRCCGARDLSWGEIDGKWRLFGDTGVHVCPVAPLPQVIKLANGSKITAAKSPHNPVRGFAPPTDEDIPL